MQFSEVSGGGSWLSSELMQKIIANHNSKNRKMTTPVLSKKEMVILRLICESYTNEKISEKLNISIDTVKWHRANMLSKTESTNTAGLVIYAIKNKIVEI